MPELPEAEANRRHVEAEALDRTVTDVTLGEVAHLDVPGRDAFKVFTGHRFTQARRHGKAVFVGSAYGPWFVVHLGMTGRLVAFDEGNAPKNAKVVFVFEGTRRLAFLNRRKLGEMDVIDSPEAHIADKGLGPDALEIGREAFATRVASGRGAIKSALMDQKKMAGIGNIWSDEVLYHAGVAPGAKCCDLSDNTVAELYDCMGRLLRRAVDENADYDRLPSDWLLHNRTEGAECPRCGGTIRKRSVSGRAAYFCDRHQKEAA